MHILPRLLLALALSTAPACLAAATEPVPLGRLPEWAVPESYALALRADPAAAGFSGSVRIRLRLGQASDHLWLHGKDLEVTRVQATDARGRRQRARWVQADAAAGVARIDFRRALPAQVIELELDYRAPYNAQLQGFYKVVHGGQPYVMTQMEPISARYAFPGFDEPRFKTPFELEITAPATAVAVANSAEVASEPAGRGWKTTRFATTPPLPTYLFAWAVGPWDIRQAGELPANRWRTEPAALRGVATHGAASRMQWILGETPAIIAWLEDYYAFGYPYGKLDLVAVPDFSAGAMENPGLVTFRDWLLLLDRDAAQDQVQASFNVTAHELAHQWTGDTVTARWWDDLWLNESFATWGQAKISEALHPEYRADLGRVLGAQRAMASDSLASARRIRQPITGNGDIQTAFDGITYSKGAAVLAMFESWVGAERFREGLRRYIARHKHGTASADDMVAAVAEVAGEGEALKKAFASFLEQSGVPLLEVRLDCSGERPRLHLRQSRYLPLGSTAEAARRWTLPVCVRTPAGTSCRLFGEAEGEFPLEDRECPAWVMPNAGARGYYQFALPAEDFARLGQAVDGLGDAEKLAYAGAVDAALRRGDLGVEAVLAAAQRLASSPVAEVALAPLPTLEWIWTYLAVDEPARAALRERLAASYLDRLEALGYARRAADTIDDTRLRTRLADFLGRRLALPGPRAALRRQADAVLAGEGQGALDFAAANPDLLDTALAVAAHDGGATAIERLMAALPATTDPARRSAILAGLAGAGAGEAARVRDFALGEAVRVGEMGRLLGVDRESRRGRDASWDWFLAHHEAVLARTGTFGVGYLPRTVGGGGCSAAEAERLEAWFGPRTAEIPGSDRGLAQTVESIRLCAALREHQRQAGSPMQ